ncbi:hypothetical protein [Hymenobacter defluvii]|uniref:Lipoprotein n=1 Tax=Hymenobacter defluvii TaxID=2054411 RepID=A0ABS3T710_9BACT|nr:hypothetical protein [Hymenobacter defluvii]MBO3269432.1 hypothetical protein [Hymenobacter defluvii]
MKFFPKTIFFAFLSVASLSSCSVFRSDVNSNNPVIAEQAQRVEGLERDIDSQERIVDAEKAKLKSMEYQLKAAKQELKARKL